MGAAALDATRCVLGTVQLGMPYGIANSTGQPGREEAAAIIGAALDSGILRFDTAQGYGVSEQALGQALACQRAEARVRVITKLPPKLPPAVWEKTGAVSAGVQASLQKLGVPSLQALLLHREEQLSLLNGELGLQMATCQRQGLTVQLGISVYTPEAALAAVRHPLVNVVQLPSSVFDRRFAAAGVFAEAERRGKEIHVRSALLQGVLCMEPTEVPPYLASLRPALTRLRAVCAEHGITAQQGALAWILHEFPAARLLFGAETVAQIHENASLAQRWHTFPASLYTALEAITVPQTPALLNPALWGKSL